MVSLVRSLGHPPTIRMLGTRGVPAAHGGFETAAENVGKLLAERGWRVVVYCQIDGSGPVTEDHWEGLDRVLVPTSLPGPAGTAQFDWKASRHAGRYRDISLVFGYNTAVLNVIQRLRRSPLIFNMDGIEWKRDRWSTPYRAFLRANERIAVLIGNDLIADHPEIERYLRGRVDPEKLTMIPYGAPAISSAPAAPVRDLGLEPGCYFTLICRPVPENSILEIVRGFSARPRGAKLVVLGDYGVAGDSYQRAVLEAAGDEVMFPGTIYDPPVTQALRFHSLAYLHGHRVGGTNPSLVEAMGAGNAIIAHDNRYNRWVAGDGAMYFRTVEDVDRLVGQLLNAPERRSQLAAASRARHAKQFTWDRVTDCYEALARQYVDPLSAPQPVNLVRVSDSAA